MILPMQFVNDVRRGDGVLFCPYCSRILFFEEESETTFAEVGSEGLADLFSDGAEEEAEDTEVDEEDVEVDDEEESDDDEDEDDDEALEEEEEE
jgi:hypothetical protein